MLTAPQVSVIICAYTLGRWDALIAAVTSVEAQCPAEIIVVIDHHPALLRDAGQRWPGHTVVASEERAGLSGARNTGLKYASGDVAAFLDDDAVALPGWLEALAREYHDERVLGVGGRIEPAWHHGSPAWFPSEFLWVVGCSYSGLPTHTAQVRNVIGANMSCRTRVALEAGGFQLSLGRVGIFPLGGEETEFCIRTAQQMPGSYWVYQPSALVSHQVPAGRQTLTYFLTRCFAEGLTKANVSRLVGAASALASERQYAARTLPLGIIRRLWAALKGDTQAFGQAGAILAGGAAVAAGYVTGQVLAQVKQTAARGQRPAGPAMTSTVSLSEGAGKVSSAFEAYRIIELELGQPLPDLERGEPERNYAATRARILCKLHTFPLGLLDVVLPPEGITATELAQEVWAVLALEINRHLLNDGQAPLGELTAAGVPASSEGDPACLRERRAFLKRAPMLSVIVATRNRAQRLPALLDLLLDLDYPSFEVLIVDNAPEDNSTFQIVKARAAHDPRLHYVREDQPGLSNARNRGVQHARADLLVITDDDVQPDVAWLSEMARGFETGENVGCVTGAILALRLDTQAQLWIEQYGGFHKGFEHRLFDLKAHRAENRLYPYAAGIFGSGANLAFRRSAWLATGGFDPALGAGTQGMGGEELAIFLQLLERGYQIAYQPAALLYHDHHRDYAALKRQMFSYGAGLTAYLTKSVWDRPARLLGLASKIPAGLAHALHPGSAKNHNKDSQYPAELTRLELRGMMYGPLAYSRSRRLLARIRAQQAQKPPSVPPRISEEKR